jgi:hypothetical protein
MGGVKNEGELELSHCEITASRGGISNSGSFHVRDSAITHNVGVYGGIWSLNGTLIVENCTISGNATRLTPTTIEARGGGINVYQSTTTVINSTITGNDAEQVGGGIWTAEGSTTLHNTIVAGNSSPTPDRNVAGRLDTASASNLFDLGGSGDLVNGVNGNIIVADPLLGPLGNHGGPTRTHLPQSGSPALEAGSNAHSSSTDQRGIPRLLDSADADTVAAVDIGAVEAHPPSPRSAIRRCWPTGR